MHRLDISEVTGIPMHATTTHEGVLVGDIVREWAARHGQDFRLEPWYPREAVGAPLKASP